MFYKYCYYVHLKNLCLILVTHYFWEMDYRDNKYKCRRINQNQILMSVWFVAYCFHENVAQISVKECAFLSLLGCFPLLCSLSIIFLLFYFGTSELIVLNNHSRLVTPMFALPTIIWTFHIQVNLQFCCCWKNYVCMLEGKIFFVVKCSHASPLCCC